LSTKDNQKKVDDTQTEHKTVDSQVIFGKTENIKMDTIERTIELKVILLFY
jgi:hypothetical protein